MSDAISSISNLSPMEKFELLGNLWDDLSDHPEQIPILDWQKEELDRRRSDMRETTWDDVKARLRAKYGP